MNLQERLEELHEELEAATTSLDMITKMNDGSVDLSFQIEGITENINTIKKEIASITQVLSNE